MEILCDFHSFLLLHLQSGTSPTHLISLTTVQTPYKKCKMRETPFCFNCSSTLLRPAISRSLSPRHGASSGCGWRNGLQYGGWLQTYSISSRGQPTQGSPPAWGFGEVLTTPHRKNLSWYEPNIKKASNLADTLVRPK
jgi:hypothetical protein